MFRKRVLGKIFGLKWEKYEGTGGDCVVRIFIIGTSDQPNTF
jgi:hypothetical protein